MTALPLTPSFIYGLNSQTQQNAHFISNDTFVYPSGGVLVIQDLQENHQNYIHLHDKQRTLNVLCISPNKDLVAIGEGGGTIGISLYSVSSREYLISLPIPADLKAKDIACLQFTCDAQFIVAVTSEPDWMLLCFNVASRALDSKTRANMATHPNGIVTEVSCNPTDATTLAVVGPGLFRLLQLVDGSWRQFGFYKAQAFPLLSVSWLTSDRLLAGTEDGRLLLIESNELKAVFQAAGLPQVFLSAKDTPVEENIPGPGPQSVTEIVAYSGGFLLGLGNPLQVAIYGHDQGATYSLRGTFNLEQCPPRQDDSPIYEEDANSIWSLTISPDCKTLLASSVLVELYTGLLSDLGEGGLEATAVLKPLGEPLHRGAVVGLSMCVWRPIFASCGVQDRSVRIWNYKTGKQELSKNFSSQPLCVTMHPLGLFLIVGFGHSLCFLSIQLDDFRVVRELAVRGCRDCKFSPGGQLFAVAHGNRVQVISSITFLTVHTLQGHCAQVEGLSWSQDDTILTTCGADGAVYEWDVASGKRIEELVTKGSIYQGISTVASGKTSFVVAGDSGIREVSHSQMVRITQCQFGTTEIQLLEALLSRNGRTLLVASRCGTVLAVVIPLGEKDAVFKGLCMHSAKVTKLAISHDGQVVVSCSEDGSVCVWRLGEERVSSNNINKETSTSVEQVLVGRGQLASLSQLSKALADRLANQQQEQDAALHYEAQRFEKVLAESNKMHEEVIKELKMEMENAEACQKNELLLAQEAAKVALQVHEEALDAVEESYRAKLLLEYHKVEELEHHIEAQKNLMESKIAEINQSHSKSSEDTCNKYESTIKSLNNKISQLQEEGRTNNAVHEEVVRQIEEDSDKEIVLLKVDHEKALRVERDKVEKLSGEVQSSHKKLSGSQHDIEELHQQKRNLQDEIVRLKSTIESLEQFIAEQKKLMDRNNIILEDKEEDLAVVRKQVSELKKEKEALSFRMEMLSQHIGPKDESIHHKTTELEQVGRELRTERSHRAQLEVELSSLSGQLKQAQKTSLMERTKHRDAQRNICRIRARIHDLGGAMQHPRQLAFVATELYRDFGRDGSSGEDQPQEALSEMKRRMESLQEMCNSLVKQLNATKENHRTECNALKLESIRLMKELDKLRSKYRITEDDIQVD